MEISSPDDVKNNNNHNNNNSNNEGLKVLLRREDQHATMDYLGINEERRRQARDQNDAPSTLLLEGRSGVRADAGQQQSSIMEDVKEWKSYLAKRETIVKWGYDGKQQLRPCPSVRTRAINNNVPF